MCLWERHGHWKKHRWCMSLKPVNKKAKCLSSTAPWRWFIALPLIHVTRYNSDDGVHVRMWVRVPKFVDMCSRIGVDTYAVIFTRLSLYIHVCLCPHGCERNVHPCSRSPSRVKRSSVLCRMPIFFPMCVHAWASACTHLNSPERTWRSTSLPVLWTHSSRFTYTCTYVAWCICLCVYIRNYTMDRNGLSLYFYFFFVHLKN